MFADGAGPKECPSIQLADCERAITPESLAAHHLKLVDDCPLIGVCVIAAALRHAAKQPDPTDAPVCWPGVMRMGRDAW